MPRRQRRAKSFSYDLLADWRPYAQLPAHNPLDWIYHGTVTLEGVTGALVWRRGFNGIAVGDYVREIGIWERIKIREDIEGRAVPGWETAPVLPEVHPEAVDPINAWSKAPPCNRSDK